MIQKLPMSTGNKKLYLYYKEYILTKNILRIKLSYTLNKLEIICYTHLKLTITGVLSSKPKTK